MKEKHQEITWRELTGLRDKLIHHYFGINLDRVWDIIKNLIPKLKEGIEIILQEDK
ncbi:MAG: HepT-like ribonuclease domain-containing protein [bacterium]